MSDERSRLGKGLEAIFGENVSQVLDEIQQERHNSAQGIALELIHPNPYQPRQHFDQTKLDELAQSIQSHGVFTPVLLRKTVSGYQLITGERRVRAAKIAGLTEIPAIVLDFDDQAMMEVALIENVQREDLNVVEEAKAYKLIIERLQLTQEALALKIGKSRVHVTNTLRLLNLPEMVLALLASQKLTMGQARPLLALDSVEKMERLAQRIVNENLSARDVERLAQQKPPKAKAKQTPSDYAYAETLMRTKLQTKVDIEAKKIHIHFTDDDDLNRILDLLNALED
jgi:ParB family chromosome partitioning protein